ncbi:MAG TPA: fasciclin domain-containing protein [Euzebyales bacterium]
MKPSVRLLSLLAALFMLLAACSTAEEAGQTEDGGDTASEPVVEETSEPADDSLTSEPALEEETEETTTDTGDDTSSTDQSIADIAADNPQLSQLTAALETAGLTSALEEAGPLTVFAPNNDAFAQLNQDDLAALLADPSSLGDILQFHVVEGAVMSTDLEDGQTVTTLQGDDLTISIDGDTVMVDDAEVVQADIQAGNGVIHVIDTVLQP